MSDSALIDRERHDRALRLLGDRAVDVTQVAIELPRQFRRLELLA